MARGLFDKLKDQLNPFDGGKTFSSPTPQPARTPQPEQRSFGQSVGRAVSGAVAQVNPLDNGRTYRTVQDRGNSFTPKAPSGVFKQATHNGLTNFTGNVAKGVGGAVTNTVQMPYSAGRLGAARLTGNKVAAQNARTALRTDAGNNMFWNDTFNKTSDILSGAITANRDLRRNEAANQQLANTLSKAYGNTPRAQMFADTYKSSLDNEDANRLLGHYGLDQNSSKADVAKTVGLPIASTGAQVVLQAAGMGAGGQIAKEATKEAVRQTIKQTGKQVFKEGAKYGGINAGISIADTMAAGGNAQDVFKNAATAFVAGGAMPVLGAGAKVAPPVIKAGAQKSVEMARRADEAAFTPRGPRVPVEDRFTLQDVSDYLSGTSKLSPSEISASIARARDIAAQWGVNISAGSRAQQLEAVNSILDQIGQQSRKVSQSGSADIRMVNPIAAAQDIAKRIAPEAPTLRPDAEQRIFDQNPMNSTRATTDQIGQRQPQTSAATLPRGVENPSASTANTAQTPQVGKQGQVQANLNGSNSEKVVPSLNNTPKQLQLKDSTAPFSNEQEKIVKEYGDMLRSVEDSATGGQMVPDGNGGYMRTSEHSRYYRDFYAQNGRKPSRADYEAEARHQLSQGKADPYAQKDFDALNDPEFRSLVASQEAATAPSTIGDVFKTDPLEGFRQKIKQQTSSKQIPVKKLVRDGDVVTERNVNPNVKKSEKRYSVDSNGELIEDRKGAYRIFTDDDGRVTHLRIGNEVFNAKDLGDLSDVNGYGSTLATMRRNIERGFGKETGEKLNQFLVDHQQAQATKLIERRLALNEGLKGVAKDLGISFGVGHGKAKKVSAAIQDFGEGKIDQAQLVEQFGADMAAKIQRADQWFRGQYDSLLDEMNETLTKYGYDPVPRRKDYYTHFQEPTLWEKFGLKMQEIRDLTSPTMQDANPAAARGKISNKLAGESEFTQPNKQFNPFALKRTGDTRTADAFGAFERYLTPTLNNIYMTPSITRARVIAKAVAQDADATGKDANKTLIQMKEWANHLAGKSNRLGDRQLADTMLGGKYLKAAQWAQRKAGANTIVGNLSTAVMQPIVLTQAAGKFGYKNTLLATIQEMSTAHANDAAIRQSEFMRRRYADLMPVTAKKTERAAEVANTPLKVVEQTAARITWNAAHNTALEKGLTGKRAIHYADVETEKTLGGRSIGERPEVFTSKTLGPVSMYQLEVNNFWQQMGKEMTKGQAAKALVAAYAFNLVLQQVTGRQVGFNPIDAAIDSYQEATKEDKSVGDKAKAIGQRFAGEVVDNTPFIAPLANATIGDKSIKKFLGNDSNVGRFGVSSPVSTLISNPWYMAMPFGGAQVKKTVEGTKALVEGKISDKNDKTLVNIPQNAGNAARGILFGKGAIPEVSQYYNNIGKKKVDQQEVQNQTNSSAANMGANLSKEKPEDYIKAGFNSPEGKEFMKLKDEDKKTKYPELYKQYEAMKKAFSTSKEGKPENYDRLDDKIKKFYDTKTKLTTEGREKWLKNAPSDEGKDLIRRANQFRPQDFPELPNTNEVASLYAEYKSRQEKEKWSKTQENNEKLKLMREAYKSQFTKGEQYWLSASDMDVADAIDNGEISKDLLDKLVGYDDIQTKLKGKAAIGNKLRRALGYSDAPKTSSGGGGTGKTASSLRASKGKKPKGITVAKLGSRNNSFLQALKATKFS